MALHVDFLSNTKKIYAGPCERIVLPAQTGVMEVLSHHVDFTVNLIPGTTKIFLEEKKSIVATGGIGVSYKKGETVTILVEDVISNEK